MCVCVFVPGCGRFDSVRVKGKGASLQEWYSCTKDVQGRLGLCQEVKVTRRIAGGGIEGKKRGDKKERGAPDEGSHGCHPK